MLFAATAIFGCNGRDRVTPVPLDSGAQLSIDSLRCVQLDTANQCALYGVSLHELLAQPREYHGKRVRVIGFAHFEFEGDALYLSREDFERGIAINALWLPRPTGSLDSIANHDVVVEATFDALFRGHFSMTSGALVNVTRMDRWQLPALPHPDSIPQIDLSRPIGPSRIPD